VTISTKSGSNTFRGSVFEYYRDDAFDSANYFDATRNNDGSARGGHSDATSVFRRAQNSLPGSPAGPVRRCDGVLRPGCWYA